MILITWRLMPAKVHPHWNRETWESENLFHQSHFERKQNFRLSNGTMVGLTDDIPPSSHCVLTAKMFRITKCQP